MRREGEVTEHGKGKANEDKKHYGNRMGEEARRTLKKKSSIIIFFLSILIYLLFVFVLTSRVISNRVPAPTSVCFLWSAEKNMINALGSKETEIAGGFLEALVPSGLRPWKV